MTINESPARGVSRVIPCKMLTPTDRFRRSVRCFTYWRPFTKCWGHYARVEYETIEIPGYEWDKGEAHWPVACEFCDYQFTANDNWWVNDERVYSDGEDEWTLRDAPAGSMWFAPWYDSICKPQLEHCLVVALPSGHDWLVDSQANNCTIPEDHRQEKHHCWVIVGTMPNITVGKGGQTCGDGSIAVPGYHGILRNGALVD